MKTLVDWLFSLSLMLFLLWLMPWPESVQRLYNALVKRLERAIRGK
jgi:hypothetical protein